MKQFSMILLFSFPFVQLACASTPTASDPKAIEPTPTAGKLVVEVTNIASNDGNISVALIENAERYEGFIQKKKAPFRAVITRNPGEKAVVEFTDLPFGAYALSVYHDKNDNAVLDRNALGIPTEDYGFSNKARSLGPPAFEKARFSFKTDGQVEAIKLD